MLQPELKLFPFDECTACRRDEKNENRAERRRRSLQAGVVVGEDLAGTIKSCSPGGEGSTRSSTDSK